MCLTCRAAQGCLLAEVIITTMLHYLRHCLQRNQAVFQMGTEQASSAWSKQRTVETSGHAVCHMHEHQDLVICQHNALSPPLSEERMYLASLPTDDWLGEVPVFSTCQHGKHKGCPAVLVVMQLAHNTQYPSLSHYVLTRAY